MQADLAMVPDGADGASEQFRANLEAFKEHAPLVHKRLIGIAAPHSSLLVEPDGAVDMALLGKRFYDRDACGYAQEQLEAYFESPHRFVLAEPDPDRLEGSSSGFCIRLKEGFEERGIEVNRECCPDDAHFLVVFGVGLGLHLETLIERTEARAVCLIEPNLECLYHSLHLVDWRGLFERFEDQERDLTLVTERSPKRISRKLQTALRRNLVTFVDGIYIYTHYRSAILQQALDHFRGDLGVALAGLGFFEDEIIMTTNATGNLAGRTVDFLCSAHPPKDEPVFIVGSGPSVQQDLDFIVANRDRAMIFSIGTGMRVLLARGVKPDFHFEIENAEFNVDLMGATVADFDMSGVTLIGSVTIQPGMVSHFDKAYLFFREELSASKIFAGELKILQPAGPTVANAALAGGLRMGFREFYLFGVDMGTRTEGKFHADESVYALGLFKDFSEEDNRFPANFGGEAIGERLLNWSRSTLEAAITAHPNITVYNCSDGARIGGAIPKVSRAIEMTNPAVDRDHVKREIAKYIQSVTPERSAGSWCYRTRQGELTEFTSQVEEILLAVADDPDPKDEWMRAVAYTTTEARTSNPVIASYFSGALQILAGVSRWYDRRIDDEGVRAKFRHHAASLMLETLRRLNTELGKLFEQVEERFRAQDGSASLDRQADPDDHEAKH